MKKKLLAFFIVLTMVFSMLPVSAFAAEEAVCEHIHTKPTVQDATCTTGDTVIVTCLDCGAEVSRQTVGDPLGHDMQLDKTLSGYVAATCTEGGNDTLKCSRCDETSLTNPTDALGHTWDKGEVVDASCDFGAGVKYTCTVCGAVNVDEFTEEGLASPALDHKYETVVTAPTCKDKGFTTHTCSVCGKSYKDSETAVVPDAHVPVVGVVLKAPTCTEPGIGKYVCDVCGASLGYKTMPSDHAWAETGRVEATCGKAGEITYTCSVCQETKKQPIDATGEHTYVDDTIDATCTDPAMVGKVCSVCGAKGDITVVDGSVALGHDLVLDQDNKDYKPATCTEAGLDTFKCSRCDYTETEITEALDHDWDAGKHTEATCDKASGVLYTCSRCDATQTDEYPEGVGTPALGHDITSVLTAPTCQDRGFTTHTCSRCDYMVVDTYVDADPDAHNVVVDAVLKAPTCTTTGIAKYKCSICGASLGYKTMASDHAWAETDRVEATCGEDGKVTYTCSVCDATKEEVLKATGEHSFVEDYIDANCNEPAKVGEVCSVCGAKGTTTNVEGSVALGHDLVLDKTNEAYKAATCTEAGLDTFKCSRCDYTETEDTEALGHKWNDGELIEADCTNAAGVKYTCSVCDDIRVEAFEGDLAQAAKGHKYEEVVTAPTCKDKGFTTHTCSVCGDTYTDTETPVNPDAHDIVVDTVLKAPTCTTTGIAKYKCSICGESLGYKTMASDHAWAETDRVEATCGEDGKVTYTCSVCDATKEEVLKATGEHSFVEDYIDANCNEPAKVGEVCSVCGAKGTTTPVEGSVALGHDLVLDKTNEAYKAATCTEAGLDTFKCSRCDYTETKATEALDHDWDAGKHTEATCDKASGVLYTCSRCDATHTEEYPEGVGTPALGHDITSVMTAPTCQDRGFTTHTCSRCDYMVVDTYVDADPDAHDPVETAVLREPTCTTNGIAKYECSICGANLGYKSVPSDHKWVESSRENATCGEDGKVTYTCSVCDATKEEVLKATGEHTYEETLIEATCLVPAKAGQVCSVCGAKGETTDVEGSVALGHDLVLDQDNEDYKPATCEEAGLDTFKCSRCDYTETVVTEALEHDWNDGEHVPATCTEDAHVKQTCGNCGETQILAYPDGVGEKALGHDYKAVVTEATCVAGGYTTHTCSRCNDSYVDAETEINPDGHDYVVESIKDATCSATGINKQTCKLCRKVTYVASEKVDHTYDPANEEVTKMPTCTEAGEVSNTCTACNGTFVVDVIDATGHIEVTISGVAPTCTEKGLTEGKKCSVCNTVLVAQEEIPALGHTSVEVPEVPATCTAAGTTAGTKCSVCGTILSGCEEIPVLNHTAVAVAEVPATCTSTGTTAGTKCSVCGTILGGCEVIPALDHTSVVVDEVPATCTTAGTAAGTKCSVCGTILDGCGTLDALGHDFDITLDFGEDEQGIWVKYGCTRCEATIIDR